MTFLRSPKLFRYFVSAPIIGLFGALMFYLIFLIAFPSIFFNIKIFTTFIVGFPVTLSIGTMLFDLNSLKGK